MEGGFKVIKGGQATKDGTHFYRGVAHSKHQVFSQLFGLILSFLKNRWL